MPSLISEHFTVTELSTLSWLKSRETAFLELWCTPAEGKGDQSYLGRSLHSLRYTVYFPVSILLWAHSSSKNRCFYSSSICRMSSHYTGWEGSQVHLHRLSVSDSPRFKQTFWATKRWHAVRKQKYGLCISKGLCFWRVTPVFSCTWLQIHTSTLTAFTSISTL